MGDPTPSLAPPPSSAPFAPGRVGSPTGCGRLALVGCGVVTLLLGVAAVVFLFKANDLLGWTLGKIENQLAAQLPAELTTEERARLTAAFASARAAVESGELDPRALQGLQTKLQRLSGVASAAPSRQEILALTESLEAVAAGPPARGTPTPAPAP